MNTDDKQPPAVPDDFEDNPRDWRPLDDEALDMFCGDPQGAMDNTQWDKFDFEQGRNEDWYQARFPLFPKEVIEILARCDGTNQPKEDLTPEPVKRKKLQAQLDEELKKKLTVSFD